MVKSLPVKSLLVERDVQPGNNICGKTHLAPEANQAPGSRHYPARELDRDGGALRLSSIFNTATKISCANSTHKL